MKRILTHIGDDGDRTLKYTALSKAICSKKPLVSFKMGKKAKKVGKNRQDKFYHLAKEQGFRSRAAFKLVQLNKRFNFLGSAARGCIDLCAAPGGWMQVVRKYLPLTAPCLGIDLVPIRAVPGCVGIVGDITSDATRTAIRRELRAQPGLSADEKVDVVLNDGSPNMGKAWLQDAYTQSELTLAALRLSTDHLAPGGTFVTKVFRSNDYNSLLYVMNQLFKRVSATKPAASRAESAEIYVLCTGYRAPKSIDPRLLNPKFVFKDMTAETLAKRKDDPDAEDSKPDLYLNTVMKAMKKSKRNREGYADGDLTQFARLSVLRFLRSPRPIALITETNQLSFNEKDIISEHGERDVQALQLVNSLEDTNPEVRSCCEDLKVLARREFKTLIKWRNSVREVLSSAKLLEADPAVQEAADAAAAAKAEEEAKKEDDSDAEHIESDTAIDEELKIARGELLAKDKRKIRKAKKLKNAIQRKIDMKIILPDANGIAEEQESAGLFSLTTANRLSKTGANLVDVEPADANDADDEADVEDENVAKAVARSGGYSLGDIEDTKKRSVKEIEAELDLWYNIYASKAKKDKLGVAMEETKERKRQTKRRALREAVAARANEQEGDNNKAVEQDKDVSMRQLELNSDASTSSEDEMKDEVDLGKDPISAREAALWFSQPMFSTAAILSSDEEAAENSANVVNSGVNVMESSIFGAAGDEDNTHRAARREAREKAEKAVQKMEEDKKEDGFEVVPQSQGNTRTSEDKKTESLNDEGKEDPGVASDSSFHSSDYDSDEKAEMVAIGKKMRTSKQDATEILDDSYNRYTFDDPAELPRWFADRDAEFRFRRPPVSKEQVTEMKEYIKSLEAAPTKKEAEAKARQKARIQKRLEAVKAKANSIAEQTEVSASSRMKALETLYKSASRSKSKKSSSKSYQVIRPGGARMAVGKQSKGRVSKGGRTTVVDRRLKADKRGISKANSKRRK